MALLFLLSYEYSFCYSSSVIHGVSLSGSAIPQYVTINQTYGGSLLDYSYSVISTSDGGFALVGYSYSYGEGQSEMWLVKTDAFGKEEWNQVIGGPDEDFGFSIIAAANNGYIIVGGTQSYGEGDYDLWLVKTENTGQVEWQRTIGGFRADYGFSIRESSDGGYILAGRTDSFGAGGTDAWLVKTDVTGQVEWNATFGGMEEDVAITVITTVEGYLVVGGTRSYGAGGMDMWLIKADEDGQVEWNQTIGGTQDDLANAAVASSDGGFVITGFTESYGMGDRDVWLIGINGTGYPEWNHTFGGVNLDYADSIICSAEGGYILAGRTESFGGGKSDMWLIKTTITGQSEWNQTFGGAEEEAAYSVITTSDGGYVVVGRTASYGKGSADTWLVKITSHPETHSPSPSHSISGLSAFIVISTLAFLTVKKRKKSYYYYFL